MSETPRTYAGLGRPLSQRRAPGRRLGPGAWMALGAVAVAVVYGLWTTRDRYPMEEFIPAEQRLQIVVSDVLNKRGKIANSRVWEALPDAGELREITDLLNSEIALPGWVVNNLIGRECHLSANRLEGLEDAIFVTRMTPVGTLLERLNLFVPGIERDRAGGLHVRRLPEAGLYYAVRGRVLVVSPSRRALIYSLTLSEEERAVPGAVAAALAAAGSEDVSGTLRLDENEGLGRVFRSLSFALQFEPDRAGAKLRGVFRPEWEERLSALLDGAEPRPLAKPVEGRLMVSVDLGLEVKELWAALGEAFENLPISRDQWAEWERMEGKGAGVLTALLGPAGPGLRLTWQGVDLNEMIPVPKVVALAQGDEGAVRRVMEALPEPPSGPALVNPLPYFDREVGRAFVPSIGGPSMIPTVGLRDGTLLVSSGLGVADALWAGDPDLGYLPDPGNIYVCLRPLPCVEAIVETGALLAENGLLKGHSPESFHNKAVQWMEKAATIREITLLAGLKEGQLEGEFHVLCAPLRR